MKETHSINHKIYEALLICIACVLFAVGIFSIALRFKFIEFTSTDLKQDYIAIQNLKNGNSIYSSEAEISNAHPPSVAMLLRPFANLPYIQLVRLWSLFSLICLFTIVWIIYHTLEFHIPKLWWLLLTGLLLCWMPIQAHIALGQLSIQIALLVTAAWAFLRQGKQREAGILIGIACLIKFFPALLVFYLVIRNHRKAVWGMLITILIGYLLTLLVVGPSDVIRYFTIAMKNNVQTYSVFPLNQSFLGLFSRLFTPGPWFAVLIKAPFLSTLFTLLTASALVVTLFYITWRQPPSPIGDDLVYALYLPAMILLSPISWGHISMLLLMPLALLVKIFIRERQPPLVILALIDFLLLSYNVLPLARALMSAYAPNQPPWYSGLVMNANTLGYLLLYGLLYHSAVRTSNMDTSTEK